MFLTTNRGIWTFYMRDDLSFNCISDVVRSPVDFRAFWHIHPLGRPQVFKQVFGYCTIMRRRWTEERRLQREQADWIVGFLRETWADDNQRNHRRIVFGRQTHQAHIISRALRKSPFVVCVEKIIVTDNSNRFGPSTLMKNNQ